VAIYDQSYAPWSGSYAPRPARIWAAARPGLFQPFKSAWLLTVIILAFVIVCAWLMILLVASTQASQAGGGANVVAQLGFAMGNNIYRVQFFNNYFFSMILMILSVAVGAPLIASDLRHNALVMYFSRAITRGDYVAAKYLTLSLFLLFVTFGPALLLWTGQIAMGAETLTWGQRFADLGSIALHSVILVAPMAAAVLACSSLTKRPYVAGILWSTLFFASTGFSEILWSALKEDWCHLISWTRLTAHLGDQCYQKRGMAISFLDGATGPALNYGWWEPLLILAGVTAAALALVRWRVRSTEAGE
jgi:ABC-type transport system involved in multi-copper enzyme maturation permease subunit